MPRGLIYVIDDVRGEYPTLKSYLKAAGYEVEVAVGARDVNVNYDVDISAVEDVATLANSYDLYAIAGGYKIYYFVTGKRPPTKRMDLAIDTQKLEALTRSFRAAGKPIIAPLAAPAYLAKLGLLANLKATVYPVTDLIRILRESGVKFTNNAVERDGGIITIKDIAKISQKDFVQALREGA